MRNKFAFMALFMALIFSGCGDDEGPYTCTSCIDEPEANAAFDATGQGIYKGVIIGSSGTIKFNIDNGDDGSITALLVIDGDEIELTTESIYNPETGFQGCFINVAAGVSICMYVSATGQEWEIYGIDIPNHNDVIIQIIKEYSDGLVRAFEGSYSGDDTGTWNMVMRLDENGNGVWVAISRRNTEPFEEGYFEGEVGEGALVGGAGDVTVTGEITGDNIKGTWDNSLISGTWKGKRTL